MTDKKTKSNGNTPLGAEKVLEGLDDLIWSQRMTMERSVNLGEIEACNLE